MIQPDCCMDNLMDQDTENSKRFIFKRGDKDLEGFICRFGHGPALADSEVLPGKSVGSGEAAGYTDITGDFIPGRDEMGINEAPQSRCEPRFAGFMLSRHGSRLSGEMLVVYTLQHTLKNATVQAENDKIFRSDKPQPA